MDENFMPLVVQCSTQMKKLVQGSNVLNKNECLHLTNISFLLVEGIQNMIKSLHGKVKLGSSMEDLYRVMKKIEVIIQDCGRVDWVHASLWQMDNEEEFREVLEELKCNFDTMCGQFQSMGVNVHGLQESIHFRPIKFLEVEEDQEALKSRLLAHVEATKECPEEQEIVKHAHKRLICRMDGEGVELDAVNFPTYHWSLELTTSLGNGACGQVFMTKCFGLDVAVKAFKKVDETNKSSADANFKKEVGVLAGLSHPNIIKFICCGEILDNQYFGNYVAMEKMDKNLADHLDNKTLKISYLVTIDIMMQIARGMFYLHDMNVAHRDLKPENVLVNFWGDSKLDGMGYVKVKLADFGIAKIEERLGIELRRPFSNIARQIVMSMLLNAMYLVLPCYVHIFSPERIHF
jgi:hypothetical protein